MRIDRILSIVMILLYRRSTTVGHLAEQFGVSERTIYRDLTTLDLAGFPLDSSPGRGGGIGLMPGFRLESRMFEPESFRVLSATLNALARATGDSLFDRDERLATELGDHEPASIDLSASLPFSWSGIAVEVTRTLRDAILRSEPVEIEYVDGEGALSARVVEPLQILLLGHDWYLQAWCRLRDDYRLFRLRRVRTIRTVSGSFDRIGRLAKRPPARLDAPSDTPAISIILRADADRRDLRERFSGQLLPAVADGTGFSIRFDWPDTPWIDSFVLGLGPGVEVVSPAHLRDRLARAVEAMWGLYRQEP